MPIINKKKKDQSERIPNPSCPRVKYLFDTKRGESTSMVRVVYWNVYMRECVVRVKVQARARVRVMP